MDDDDDEMRGVDERDEDDDGRFKIRPVKRGVDGDEEEEEEDADMGLSEGEGSLMDETSAGN
jgi:hypothetical protein